MAAGAKPVYIHEHRAKKWIPVFRKSDAMIGKHEHHAKKWMPVFRDSNANEM
jgi:hypothetical protein